MTLEQLNNLPPDKAANWFQQTCAAQNWCENMVQARPFQNKDSLLSTASDIWQNCTTKDFLQAFEAHPMIGNVDSLREKFKNTQAMASHEQSSAKTAGDNVLQELHDFNQRYLQKHGFIFIIFATGKTAQEMLSALQMRIDNSTETEIQNAAAEQIKITLLRLSKNLDDIQEETR